MHLTTINWVILRTNTKFCHVLCIYWVICLASFQVFGMATNKLQHLRTNAIIGGGTKFCLGGGGGGTRAKLMLIGTYNIISQDTMNKVCVGESNIMGGGHVPPVPTHSPPPFPRFLHLWI